MYVAVVPNRNSPPAILLRESYRFGNTVKTRTLANLSRWPQVRIDALRQVLRGDLDGVAPEGEPVCGPVFGLLYALKQIADEIGITAALGRKRFGKLQQFLTLARVAHQGSRLSAVRWAKDQAVAENLGLTAFDEDDLYAALDEIADRQETIEVSLYRRYIKREGEVPVLFLYDVTSSYFEGEKNELAAYGYNRDGKKGKKQLVIGLMTDAQGEPICVRVFSGNTADPATVSEQIQGLKERFRVQEVVFVGDRGMVKANGKAALTERGMRYITALTDPQIRKLLKRGVIQLGLFDERVCEVEADGRRYLLRKNESEARKEMHRLEDKLKKLYEKVRVRNEVMTGSLRCQPEAGLRSLQKWMDHYRLSSFVSLRLDVKKVKVEINLAAKEKATELSGCYIIETDVPKAMMDAQTAHDRYKDLAHVERDIRTLKTGLLEVRPIFLQKAGRTRGHVFVCLLALKLSREVQRRLSAVFETTDDNPYTVTLKDALAALGRLCLLSYRIDKSRTVTRLPRPDAHQQRILEALHVPLPSGFNVGRSKNSVSL